MNKKHKHSTTLTCTIIAGLFFITDLLTQESVAQELVEEGIEIKSISLGTHNPQGISILAEIEAVDEHHHFGRNFEALITYPDGTEAVAFLPFGIRDSLKSYYWGNLFNRLDLDDPGEYRLQPGEYGIEIAVDADEDDLTLHAETSFIFPEEEVGNRLDRVDSESVELDHAGDIATITWEAVEGAITYLVQIGQRGADIRYAVTTEPEVVFEDVTDPLRVMISAYTAEINENYEGDGNMGGYTAPPVIIREVHHTSSQLVIF